MLISVGMERQQIHVNIVCDNVKCWRYFIVNKLMNLIWNRNEQFVKVYRIDNTSWEKRLNYVEKLDL